MRTFEEWLTDIHDGKIQPVDTRIDKDFEDAKTFKQHLQALLDYLSKEKDTKDEKPVKSPEGKLKSKERPEAEADDPDDEDHDRDAPEPLLTDKKPLSADATSDKTPPEEPKKQFPNKQEKPVPPKK